MKYLFVAAVPLMTVSAEAAVQCELEFTQPCKPITPPVTPYHGIGAPLVPPPEFDKPFAGTITENIAKDMSDMEEWCHPHPLAGRVLGCSMRYGDPSIGKGRCYIYIAPDWYLALFGVTKQQVRRHEIGHCNAWRHPTDPSLPLPKSALQQYRPKWETAEEVEIREREHWRKRDEKAEEAYRRWAASKAAP